MTTWAEVLASDDREIVVWATIQGVGDALGLWRFATNAAWALGPGEGTWLPLLVEAPNALSIQVPVATGGVVTEQGNLRIEVLDEEDILTSALTFEAPPIAALSAEALAGVTTLDLDDSSGLTPDAIVFVGSEAVRVVSVGAGTAQVERARLDTFPTDLPAGAPVFSASTFLEGRELRLYVAPLAGSAAETRLLGVYVVTGQVFDRSLSTWTFSGRARSYYLERLTPRNPVRGELNDYRRGPGFWVLDGYSRLTAAMAIEEDSSEILQIDAANGQILTRGHLFTEPEDLVFGEWTRVPSAQDGDFRYQEAGAAGKGSFQGTWVDSSNWADLALNILTSSPFRTSPPDNYDPSSIVDFSARNYSAIPGYGLGVPFGSIVWDDFERARAVRPIDLPYFALPVTPRPGREVLDQIGKLVGAYFYERAGLIRVGLSELPLEGDTPSVVLDADDILLADDLPDLGQPRRHREQALSRVVYKLVNGQTVTVEAGDFPRLVDPAGLYGVQGEELPIDAVGFDPRDRETLIQLGGARLWRALHPSLEVDARVDPEHTFDWPVGQAGLLTLEGLPDFAQGVRGLTAAKIRLLEEEPRFQGTSGPDFHLALKLLIEPNVQVGRIGPSGYVSAVTSSQATLHANRFTAADAPAGLPTTDAAAFAEGDVVRLVNPDGTDAGGGLTETVDGIAGDVLTLSGDFGTALATGLILVAAQDAESAPQQLARLVYWTRGWRFAE